MSLTLTIIDLSIKAIGLIGTATAAGLGIRSYMRNEEWRRAEFLAKEMKEFLSSSRVQNALIIIDWSARSIPLLGSSETGQVVVRRDMSTRALYPHSIDGENEKVETDVIDGARVRRYTKEEAAIRDCFDAFLDGLERFNAYRVARLVTIAQLKPHLEYWIRDIAASAQSPEEAAWSAALLTYIRFYGFEGVMDLFSAFGYPIGADSTIYRGFLKEMTDRDLAGKLEAQARLVRPQFGPTEHGRT
jgi:hypothetical protein